MHTVDESTNDEDFSYRFGTIETCGSHASSDELPSRPLDGSKYFGYYMIVRRKNRRQFMRNGEICMVMLTDPNFENAAHFCR